MAPVTLTVVLDPTLDSDPDSRVDINFTHPVAKDRFDSAQTFLEALIDGRRLPPMMGIQNLNVSAIVSAVLFLHRPLAISGEAARLAYGADLVVRKGVLGASMLPQGLGEYLLSLEQSSMSPMLSVGAKRELLTRGATQLRAYLEGILSLEGFQMDPEIYTYSLNETTAFLSASTLQSGWLYGLRAGTLQAIVATPTSVGVFRRSLEVPWRIKVLCAQLNQTGTGVWEPKTPLSVHLKEGTTFPLGVESGFQIFQILTDHR